MGRNAVLRSIVLFFLTSSMALAAADLNYREGNLLVRFKNPTARQLRQLSRPYGNRTIQNVIANTIVRGSTVNKDLSFTAPGLSVIKLPKGKKVADAIVRFDLSSSVVYAEPDYARTLMAIPNDPGFQQQWGLNTIKAPQAWDISTGDPCVIVAVLDSGCDVNHPDIKGHVWIKANADPNAPIEYGYDTAGKDGNSTTDGDISINDIIGHGTHVAGVIGAVTDNSNGVSGVCWNVRLMTLKIVADNSKKVYVSDEVAAIYYAIQNGANVINASYASDPNSYSESYAEYNALDNARKKNVFVVCAAGDSGRNTDSPALPVFPAAFSAGNSWYGIPSLGNVISVMATNQSDRMASYSNYGATSVDLGAPGGEISSGGIPTGGIYSTLPVAKGSYGYMQGTSMSAAYVSGAAALLLAIDPTLTPAKIKLILNTSVDSVLPGRCISGGRLNLFQAAKMARKGRVYNATAQLFYPTIQDAINNAFEGDDIIAESDHWYFEKISFLGSNIRVRSGDVNDPCNLTVHPENTYISGAFVAIPFPVVMIASGEGPTSVLSGFGITGGNAGGISLNSASPTITDCNVIRNTGAPGIRCVLANAVLTRTTVIANTSTVDGGGISCSASSPTITNCTISGNSATGNGGGIYFYFNTNTPTQPRVTGSTISSNTASDRGGGIYCVDSDPAISSSTISSNQSVWEGGGIFLESSLAKISDCTIATNVSQWDGGGIFCDTGSNAAITNSTIHDNSAKYDGGGIYCFEVSSAMSIKNDLFYNNTQVGWDGGAIFCSSASPGIVNCTFANNSGNSIDGQGGAIFCLENSDPSILNCIFKDNAGYAIYENDAQSNPSVAYCLFYDNSPFDYFIPHGTATTGNKTGNPLFVRGRLGNFYLSQTAAGQVFDANGNVGNAQSPAVDAGLFTAANLGLNTYSTRTDNVKDTAGNVDMGFHYNDPVAGATYSLTVVAAPTAGGTVTTIPAATGAVKQFAPVRLHATPNSGYRIVSWSGTDNDAAIDPNGDGAPDNVVTMSSSKTVTVTFEKNTIELRVTALPIGSGNVSITPAGSGSQGILYPRGTVVTITVTPMNLSNIVRWTGTDSDSSIDRTNKVTMGNNVIDHGGQLYQTVNITFAAPRTLLVTTSGGGDPSTSYSSIQRAIDAAKPGDIVRVDVNPQGWNVYEDSEGIDPNNTHRWIDHLWIDKDITIIGTLPADPCVVAQTVLNGGIKIASNVTRNTIISGLTIRATYTYTDGCDGLDIPCGNPLIDGQNGSNYDGGGIELLTNGFAGASPTVVNCIFDHCKVTGSNGGNGASKGGDGGWAGWAHGGGVSVGQYGSPIFKNCKFIGCQAIGGDGGNGASDGGHGGNWGDEDDPRWQWADHLGMGGGYLPYYKYSGFGGAVYCDVYSTPEFIDCNFVDNRAIGGSCGISGGIPHVAGWPYQHYKLDRFGGAVFCANNSAPKFTGCTFTDNQADPNAKTTHHEGDTPTVASDIYLSYGGAIAFEDNATPTFERCAFNGNQADLGGAVYGEWGDARFGDCNFVDNSAYHGGGLYLIKGGNKVGTSKISLNKANNVFDLINPDDFMSQGGGIFIFDANAAITDCTINDNTSTTSGGGIYIAGGSNKQMIRNCLITNNRTGRDGGGVSINGWANTTITNCTIVGNTVSGTNAGIGYGGGIYTSYQSYARIINSIIWGNSSINGLQIAIGTGFDADKLPADVNVSYSDVQGGANGVYFDTGVSHGKLHWDYSSNLNDPSKMDPKFVNGYYLSEPNTNAKDQKTLGRSPCIDSGKYDMAKDANTLHLWRHTTRTDNVLDTGRVDIGYHYVRYADIVGDYNFDGKVDMTDMALFMQHWLNSNCDFPYWCDGRDLDKNGKVDAIDKGIFNTNYGHVETTPPNPNPMTWTVSPYYVSSPVSIKMKAVTAVDNSGYPVQYCFQRTTVTGAPDGAPSAWSADPNYTDKGITAGSTYGYMVKARDVKSSNQNDPADAETGWSAIAFVTASGGVNPSDKTAPSPNPLTWLSSPAATSNTTIAMTATTATDATGPVYYFFQNTTLSTHNSGWRTSPTWTDTGLTAGATYGYKVQARDSVSPANVGGWSATVSATTTGGVPDANAPTPNPMTFTTQPHSVSSTEIDMVATIAQDVSGVEYQFERTDSVGNKVDSAWQSSTMYQDTTVAANTSYSYAVRARDKSPTQNMTAWSAVVLVDRIAPTPNPLAWVSPPTQSGVGSSHVHSMTCAAATDASQPVSYRFVCVDNSSVSSGWQTSTSYTAFVGGSHLYRWYVIARDSFGNTQTGSGNTMWVIQQQ